MVFLQVSLTAGCFQPGVGRIFNVSMTIAVLPPPVFASWGVISSPVSPFPSNRGYVRPLVDAFNFSSLGYFYAGQAAAVSSLGPAILSSLSFTYPGSLILSAPVLSPYTKVPSNFLYQATVSTVGSALQLITSFVPDVPGVYTLDATVVDDCPGSTPVSWSSVSAPYQVCAQSFVACLNTCCFTELTTQPCAYVPIDGSSHTCVFACGLRWTG